MSYPERYVWMSRSQEMGAYSMSEFHLAGTKVLQALVGLKLSVGSYAGNMRKFGINVRLRRNPHVT